MLASRPGNNRGEDDDDDDESGDENYEPLDSEEGEGLGDEDDEDEDEDDEDSDDEDEEEEPLSATEGDASDEASADEAPPNGAGRSGNGTRGGHGVAGRGGGDNDDDANLNQMRSPTFKQALKILAGAARSQTVHNKNMIKLLARSIKKTRESAPSDGRDPRHAARRRRHGPAAPARRALLADGLPRLFGPGHRATVAKVVGAKWFKHVGAPSVLVPYNTMVHVIMPLFNLNPSDADDRTDFDGSYRSESSKVQSKEKNRLSNIFVEGILTLNDTPMIVGGFSATPPNMAAHQIKFPLLKNPPNGLDANNPRRRFMNSWHAEMVNGHARAFAKQTARKNFQVDFLARSKLDPAHHDSRDV